MATYRGDLGETKRLLDGGANVNGKDDNDATALFYAAGFGNTEVVKLLLDRGAEVNARHKDGRSPLHQVSFNGKIAVAALLLARGADLSIRDNTGKTAEDWATEKGRTALATYLSARTVVKPRVAVATPPRVAAASRTQKPQVAVAPPPPLAAASRPEKPRAAVAPLAVLGKISEVQQRVLFNNLESHLSTSYQLISAEEFQRAQETAFSVLELEQCTVEQCIRKIQEILQVERLFVLQVLREGAFTQLSLTLVVLDGRVVKSDNCENCSISALNAKVGGLVAATVAADRN